MRHSLRIAISTAACLMATSASALESVSTYSPLQYRARDGYVWDSNTGLWRSPAPVLDRRTGRREYLTRNPSSTTCCDRTGLSFPEGSVNPSIGEAAPAQAARRSPARDRVPGLRERLRKELARPVDDIDAQIQRVRRMDAPEEAKQRVIRDLENKRPGRRTPAPPSDEAETSGGSGSNLYGRLAGQSAGELENTARARRHDPSNDMTLGDVMGAVSGGLAAGAAVGGAFRQGQAVRSGQPYSQGRSADTTQGRRSTPPMPAGRDYNPYRSTISGTSR